MQAALLCDFNRAARRWQLVATKITHSVCRQLALAYFWDDSSVSAVIAFLIGLPVFAAETRFSLLAALDVRQVLLAEFPGDRPVA
jgi:hypothetical protein